jgi:hypothetical protein
LITYDTGQATRGSVAGLQVNKLVNPDSDPEPKPTVDRGGFRRTGSTRQMIWLLAELP